MQTENERTALVEINLAEVKTARELHRELAQALDFPDFYGHNWDAFWDAITGLVEMPKKLVILGWDSVQEKLPEDAAAMLEILKEHNTRYPVNGTKVKLRDRDGSLVAAIPIRIH